MRKIMGQFINERDKAVASLDIDKFKQLILQSVAGQRRV